VLTVARGELDVDRFQALVQEGRNALAAGRVAEAAEKLREALALWRGPPLAEFAPSLGSTPFRSRPPPAEILHQRSRLGDRIERDSRGVVLATSSRFSDLR